MSGTTILQPNDRIETERRLVNFVQQEKDIERRTRQKEGVLCETSKLYRKKGKDRQRVGEEREEKPDVQGLRALKQKFQSTPGFKP